MILVVVVVVAVVVARVWCRVVARERVELHLEVVWRGREVGRGSRRVVAAVVVTVGVVVVHCCSSSVDSVAAACGDFGYLGSGIGSSEAEVASRSRIGI